MEVLRGDADFYTTLPEALKEIDPKWETYPGLIMLGSHKPEQVEEKLEALKKARKNKIPTLGICLGMQLMAVEYARNVFNWKNAHTIEVGRKTRYKITKKLPTLNCGILPVLGRMESHWHRYKFNNQYLKHFGEDWGIVLENNVVEMMRLTNHPFYVGIQYHPEYQSSKDKPHPLLKEFVDVCRQLSYQNG